ncbi:MAG: cyclodeaminase/cyclohydrolase family protein [Candidatus Bipolaricaulota bacterium]|nr:cyclodeaminase/cyclohydrolase family protein [Candidatus Bipolaricaulota bacterium]
MCSRTIGDFLQGVAFSIATPDGGSVAMLSGAIAADLGCMVCRLVMNKKPSDDLANLNVRINLAYMHDKEEIKKIETATEDIERRCSDLSARALSSIAAL